MSSTVKLVCSVLQGSVLGLLLFILYTSELPEVASCYNIHVRYADDRELFLHCKLHDADAAATNVEKFLWNNFRRQLKTFLLAQYRH